MKHENVAFQKKFDAIKNSHIYEMDRRLSKSFEDLKKWIIIIKTMREKFDTFIIINLHCRSKCSIHKSY